MFRLMRLKPPNGWSAVGWELAIVTLGVFIALLVQQWADDRDWSRRVDKATQAIKTEIADHYYWSAEWRMVAPCLLAQVDSLSQRIQASGSSLSPAPVHREAGLRFVLRMPAKEYVTSAWDAAQVDGITPRLDADVRAELNRYYEQVRRVADHTERNGIDYRRLFVLSRPIPLDASTRFQLLQTLDELRGRIEFVDLLSGQLIDRVQRLGMVPSAADTRKAVERYRTVQFCRDQGLPLREMDRAVEAVAN